MAASYPAAAKSFTAINAGDTVTDTMWEDAYDEITAIEQALISGLAHDLKFTDALYDIGKSGATRPRDLFLSRNAVVGGTLGVNGRTYTFPASETANYALQTNGSGTLVWAAMPRTAFWGNTAAATIVAGTTTYMGPHGANTTESSMRFVIPFAGTLKNLYVRADGSPSAGQTFTYAVMVNGSASALTCATADAAITSNDTTHSVTVSAGDTVDVRLVTSASASARGHTASFEIQG